MLPYTWPGMWTRRSGNMGDPACQTNDMPQPKGIVLYVEDNANVREALTDALDAQGYKIIAANDGSEALRLMVDAGEIDLLLADIVLPGVINGIELAEAVQKSQPGAGILLITGYSSEELAKRGIAEENFKVLRKPVRLNELIQSIADVLEERPRE